MEEFPSFSEINLDSFRAPISSAQIHVKVSGGPIKPNCLPSEIEEMLNCRIGDEYSAHYFYRNAANWCAGVNYPNAAKYFNDEADAELEHAKKIQDYLVQWNNIPKIPTVETRVEFNSLVQIINQAYSIEHSLLEKYSADQVVCLGKHPSTFNFIQEYVNFQTESVKEYSDLLNALELINFNNKLDLLIFEKNYFI